MIETFAMYYSRFLLYNTSLSINRIFQALQKSIWQQSRTTSGCLLTGPHNVIEVWPATITIYKGGVPNTVLTYLAAVPSPGKITGRRGEYTPNEPGHKGEERTSAKELPEA